MNTIFMCNNTTRMYKPTDKMGDLICENYALLQVMVAVWHLIRVW